MAKSYEKRLATQKAAKMKAKQKKRATKAGIAMTTSKRQIKHSEKLVKNAKNTVAREEQKDKYKVKKGMQVVAKAVAKRLKTKMRRLSNEAKTEMKVAKT